MSAIGDNLKRASAVYLAYREVYEKFCKSIDDELLSEFGIFVKNDMLTYGQQVGFEFLHYSFAYRFEYLPFERHKGKLLFYSVYLDTGAKFDEKRPLIFYFDEYGNIYSSAEDDFSLQSLLKDEDRIEFILKCVSTAAGLDKEI